MALLTVESLSVNYSAVRALTDVSIDVDLGELVVVLGANGAGKTTLLRAISGLVRPRVGHIRYDNTVVDHRSIDNIARTGIGHVPEGRHIFGSLTVEENLLVGAVSRGSRAAVRPDMDRVFGLFPDLAARRRQEGWSLSGGQQQMLAVGRALMGHPRLLMLDEPSLGLAPMLVRQVLDVVRQIRDDGVAVLLVEQNAAAALKIADRGYVLRNGEVMMHGTAEDLRRSSVIASSYLGAH